MSRIDYLKTAIAELATWVKEGKTLSSLLEKYQGELRSLAPLGPLEKDSLTGLKAGSEALTGPTTKKPTGLSQWYQENNIVLLLYLGALLIVLSAATFVAFNWESITNIVKFFALVLVTLGFLGSGLLIYYQSAKLKIAGVTFATIGALLIPFNGVAFYNFICQGTGPIGYVWLVTSLISLATFAVFIPLFHRRFFKYLAVLATLSFVESFVNLGQFEARYYVLGAIITSFILLTFSKLSQENKRGRAAFALSAQILLPLSLFYGLLLTLEVNTFYTPLTAIALFLATIFYAVTYHLYRQTYALYAVPLLFTALVGNCTYTTWSNTNLSLY